MTVSLSPTIGIAYQSFTNGGLPNKGGFINTYAANGTTPQATYTTSAGNVANDNPIELDAYGRPPHEVWLTDGLSYRFDIKDVDGNVLMSYHDVYGIQPPISAALAASSGSSLVGFIQAGTGAVATTLQTKNRQIVSAFDFMTAAQIADVKARTLSLDVTTAVQNAINSVKGVDGLVHCPTGSYLITDTLTTTGSSVTEFAVSIQGDGRENTVFINALTGTGIGPGGNPTKPLIDVVSTTSGGAGIGGAHLRDFAIRPASNPTYTVGHCYNGTGIRIRKACGTELHNLDIRNMEVGIWLNNDTPTSSVENTSITHCYISGCFQRIAVAGSNATPGESYHGLYINDVELLIQEDQQGIYIGTPATVYNGDINIKTWSIGAGGGPANTTIIYADTSGTIRSSNLNIWNEVQCSTAPLVFNGPGLVSARGQFYQYGNPTYRSTLPSTYVLIDGILTKQFNLTPTTQATTAQVTLANGTGVAVNLIVGSIPIDGSGFKILTVNILGSHLGAGIDISKIFLIKPKGPTSFTGVAQVAANAWLQSTALMSGNWFATAGAVAQFDGTGIDVLNNANLLFGDVYVNYTLGSGVNGCTLIWSYMSFDEFVKNQWV